MLLLTGCVSALLSSPVYSQSYPSAPRMRAPVVGTVRYANPQSAPPVVTLRERYETHPMARVLPPDTPASPAAAYPAAAPAAPTSAYPQPAITGASPRVPAPAPMPMAASSVAPLPGLQAPRRRPSEQPPVLLQAPVQEPVAAMAEKEMPAPVASLPPAEHTSPPITEETPVYTVEAAAAPAAPSPAPVANLQPLQPFQAPVAPLAPQAETLGQIAPAAGLPETPSPAISQSATVPPTDRTDAVSAAEKAALARRPPPPSAAALAPAAGTVMATHAPATPEEVPAQNTFQDFSLLQDPLQTQSLVRRDGAKPFHLPPAARGCDDRVPVNSLFALPDVLRFILCHNPDTRESWANVLGSAASLGAARSEYLPNLSGSVQYERSRFSPDGGSSTTTTSENHGVALDYLLFDFGGREARVEGTKQDLLAANYAHDATLRNVVFQGITAYYNLLSARASVDAARETERANYAGYEAARLRYEVGAAAIADQLQAETAYAQSRLDRERAENLMKQREGELATLMGLAPNAPFGVQDNDFTSVEDGLMADVSPLLDKALAARPEISASRARVKGAEASVDAAWAAHWPTIRAGVSQNYSNTITGPGGDNDSTRFGVSVSIPLFSGFSTSYRVRQAQQQLAAESARQYAQEQDVLLEVWNRYQDYGTARQNLDTTATLITSAQQSYEVALGRYRAGAGSILDLLNAQAQLADARQQRVAALYNWLTSRTDLVRAVGNVDWLTVTEAPVATNR